MNDLYDFTWDELENKFFQEVHIGILEKGAEGLRESIYDIMRSLISWYVKNNKLFTLADVSRIIEDAFQAGYNAGSAEAEGLTDCETVQSYLDNFIAKQGIKK